MKNCAHLLLLLLLLLLPAGQASAQQKPKFRISSFRENPMDLSAKHYEKLDADGHPYAIIKVTSDNPDDDLSAYRFSFEHIPSLMELKESELWVYVGRNAMYVTISREGYHSISQHELNTTIQPGRVYNMQLTAESKKIHRQMLLIEVTPANSQAYITYKEEGGDEKVFGNGNIDEAGMAAMSLPLGTYTYRIISKNYHPSEGRIALSTINGKHIEKVTLRPNFANVTLNAAPGVDIYINDEKQSAGSWSGILTPGSYSIECRQANHKSSYQTITVEEGKDMTLRLPAPTPITGVFSCMSSPLGAKITIDGKECGETPNIIDNLLIGTHKVTVSKPGYADSAVDIVIKEGETTEQTVTLQRLPQNSGNIVGNNSGNVQNHASETGTINGHEYVDLGLPSGVKWATCNVGASKPEEYGNYYAWGETSTKSSYTENNSVTYGKNFSDIGGNPAYDVARKQWGSPWRLPTKAEFNELLNNCTWTWTEQNGIKGCKVTSKKNGNSIFLPAAGWRDGTSLYYKGIHGCYWSSTPRESSSSSAYYLDFNSVSHCTYWNRRYFGQSVRPVSGGIENKTEKTSNAKPASNKLSTRTFKVKDVEFTMVTVEGGTFSMGSNDGDRYEKPVHQVTLDSYCIGQTEVTQALWQAVMGTTIHDQAKKGTYNQDLYGTGDNNPMYYISYKDCIRFIKKLNKLLKDQLPQGRQFRLPTEAEWEYAARGGNKSKGCKYSGSNSISTVAWYRDNSGIKTHPVKQKAGNELGLYDMSGNVYEWCSDWYDDYSSSPQNNPKGPGSGSLRVIRGGGWNSYEQDCRSANRDFNGPGYRYGDYGLRLAF